MSLSITLIKFLSIFLISLAFQYLLIFLFRKRQLFQFISEGVPETHRKKNKTPSLGGIGIAGGILFGVSLFSVQNDSQILAVLILMGLFFSIGLIDDGISLLRHRNVGLTAKQKFLAQCIVGAVFLWGYVSFVAPINSVLLLGLYLFIIVGAPNATNLTDGLDGLLTGLALLTSLGFSLLFFKLGHTSLLILSGIVMTVLMAFFVVNRHPAKIFMGDVGSLLIGALFAGYVIVLQDHFSLLILGAVYVLEVLSVILQVFIYKLKKKRFFLQSPLHHHFELMGMSEVKVVTLFWSVGFIFLLIFIADRSLL